MEFLFVVVFLLLVKFFVYPALSSNSRQSTSAPTHSLQSEPLNYPYHLKYILTASEYKFYLVLRSITDLRSFIICPKVGLKDLFEVNSGIQAREKYFAKISQKHLDFLICDSDLRPLFAIELDDKSHKMAATQARDQFKDALFQNAGLPLYRVPTASSYSEEYIKQYVLSL